MSLPLNKVSSQFVLQIPNSGQKATFAALSATPENSTNYYSPFIRSERFCDLRKFGADVIMDVLQYSSDDYHQKDIAGESFLCSARGVLERTSRARRRRRRRLMTDYHESG